MYLQVCSGNTTVMSEGDLEDNDCDGWTDEELCRYGGASEGGC